MRRAALSEMKAAGSKSAIVRQREAVTPGSQTARGRPAGPASPRSEETLPQPVTKTLLRELTATSFLAEKRGASAPSTQERGDLPGGHLDIADAARDGDAGKIADCRQLDGLDDHLVSGG